MSPKPPLNPKVGRIQQIMAAPGEEVMEEEDDSRWSDWEESDGEGGQGSGAGRFLPLCVPSTSGAELFKTAAEALAHDASNNNFDVRRIVKELRVGFYDCMK